MDIPEQFTYVRFPDKLIKEAFLALKQHHPRSELAFMIGVSVQALYQWERMLTRPGRAASFMLLDLVHMTAEQREAMLQARIECILEHGKIKKEPRRRYRHPKR